MNGSYCEYLRIYFLGWIGGIMGDLEEVIEEVEEGGGVGLEEEEEEGVVEVAVVVAEEEGGKSHFLTKVDLMTPGSALKFRYL